MNTVKKIIDKIRKDDPRFMDCLPEIVHTRTSRDSTVKLLLRLSDGCRIESVIIPFHKRHTLCLSTQAGCAMGCTFCRTGTRGLERSLDSREIVGQYLVCFQWIIDNHKGRHIAKPNIVFMGEGEPLHNFENVKEACGLFLSKRGVYLGPRQITVSTVGFLPGLARFRELPPVNLALSLHAAFSGKRKEIIPLENKYRLDQVLDELRTIPLLKNQYINFEYLLIAGFNDSEDDARALASIASGFKAIVNIIPYNEIPGLSWNEPSGKSVALFKEMLVARDIRTMVRISKGKDIEAACGQLKGSVA